MTEKLALSHLLAEADELRRAARHSHRDRVQSWFDQLPKTDKNRLAE